MEVIDRPSAWERLGPFGQFLVGVVIVAGIATVGVKAVEIGFALTVRTPTVDQLPERVSICGRDYRRAHGGPLDLRTLDEERALGPEPVVVLPLRIQPCIDGPCNRGRPGTSGCATVVFVRIQGDRYAAYALLGGP